MERLILAMSGYNTWFGILAGVFAIIDGMYMLLRPSSVARRLAKRGVQCSLLQVKMVGVSAILAGVFFVVVAIRNH